MQTLTAAPRPAVGGVRTAIVVAVCGSALAGLVHAAAARSHDGDGLLAALFVLCAAAQVLWAVAVAIRPRRSVLLAGLVINGGALVVWALTRTVGIPFIDSLADVESVGTQDRAAAMLAAVSVVAAVRILARPVVAVRIAPAWAGALAVVALIGTLPALRAQHTHDHSDHSELEAAGLVHGVDDASHDDGEHADHADDGAHADDPAHSDDPADGHHDTAAGAEHDDTTGATHGDDHTASGDLASHGSDGTTDATHGHDGTTNTTHGTTDTTHGHDTPGTTVPHDHPTTTQGPGDPVPTGPIISLDDPRVTDAQRAVAVQLITSVQSWLSPTRFPNVAAVTAAGYTSIGDGGTDGYEHFVNWSYLTDGIELTPSKIESIVIKKSSTGTKTIVSGMYILNLGKTMANVPSLAGELTTWHDHQNLCFSGTTLVGLAVNGVCAQGTLLPTPPMLHVWLIDNPCGPFAGIEDHGVSCGHDGH